MFIILHIPPTPTPAPKPKKIQAATDDIPQKYYIVRMQLHNKCMQKCM